MAEEQAAAVAATKEERSTGRVVRFSDKKGFGFIKPDVGDKDLFVHHSAIKSDGGYRTLYEDDVVEFTVLLNEDKYQAIEVTAPGGGPIKRRTTIPGGFGRRNNNINAIAVAILVAISVEAVVILRGSARRGITMGVTVVEGLGMWQGTVRVGLELVITAVGMDIWLGIAPAQEELVVEGLAVVIVVDVLIVVRKGTLLGIV
ncbi:hypothetical protein OIU78_028642, partial [Salix suchowensis]